MADGRGRIARLLAAVAICALAAVAGTNEAKKKDKPADVPVICHDVAIVGRRALLAQTLGMSVWDISDPMRPKATERLQLPATVLGVTPAPPLVYLAAGTRGMYVTRLADEGPPTVVGRFDTPGSVQQIVLHGSYALLADSRYGVRAVDVSDPERPLQKAQLATRGDARSLALHGDILAVAEGKAGVRLFDVSRPERPLELHVLREMKEARDVAWAGDRLLVAAGPQGLWVYALADPKPVRLGRLDIDRSADFVGAEDELVLVSNGTPTIDLVELDGDGRPVLLDGIRVHRSAPAWRVHVVGSRGIAALDRASLAVIDLSDPLVPVVLLPRERELKIDWPGMDAPEP